MDAPWIGKLVSAAILVAIVAFFWVAHLLTKRGVFKNYSRGLGRGLFEVEAMLRPSRQYIRDAKQDEKEVNDDQGGPEPK
jgi:hypothetical protein